MISADGWLAAFILTQVLEMPVYLRASRALAWPSRLACAFGASTLTHPVIWHLLPWERAPYVPLLLAAEMFAVGVEALWLRAWRVPHPWLLALFANGFSLIVGSVLRWGFTTG